MCLYLCVFSKDVAPKLSSLAVDYKMFSQGVNLGNMSICVCVMC